jgi:rod shape-determining protein MreC
VALSRRTGRSRFTLVLLILTSVTVLTLDFRGSGAVEGLRDGASSVFSPVRGGAERVFGPMGDAWNGVWHYNDVRKENDQLRAEIDSLRGQQAQQQDAQKQLQTISDLDKISQWTTLAGVDARIVAGPLTNFEHTLELNKGSSDGIAVGMPVVTGAGLVGRITDVEKTRSVVKLLSDPDVVVGIRLFASQETGLMHGTGEGQPLVIDEGIGPKVMVPPNDLVTTSGEDRATYPPNIPIGNATAATLSSDQLHQIVTVAPLADLGNITLVKVLLWQPAP